MPRSDEIAIAFRAKCLDKAILGDNRHGFLTEM